MRGWNHCKLFGTVLILRSTSRRSEFGEVTEALCLPTPSFLQTITHLPPSDHHWKGQISYQQSQRSSNSTWRIEEEVWWIMRLAMPFCARIWLHPDGGGLLTKQWYTIYVVKVKQKHNKRTIYIQCFVAAKGCRHIRAYQCWDIQRQPIRQLKKDSFWSPGSFLSKGHSSQGCWSTKLAYMLPHPHKINFCAPAWSA